MDQGEEKSSEEKQEEKMENNLPPPQQNNQLDFNNNFIMSTNKELNFLKYLERKYKKFLANPNLSDVITVEGKLGNALYAIQNNYKDG